jgi:hypothetical protein
MNHQEQKKMQHDKERERDIAQRKQLRQEGEIQEKKGLFRTPRPFGLMVVGLGLTLFVVLGRICFF